MKKEDLNTIMSRPAMKKRNAVHPHDCGFTITGHIHNCSCGITGRNPMLISGKEVVAYNEKNDSLEIGSKLVYGSKPLEEGFVIPISHERSSIRLVIEGAPIGKPRMTKRDKWMQRPCVQRFWVWKKKAQAALNGRSIGGLLKFTIHAQIPMPKSWPEKKKQLKNTKPHDAKPDLDNICKAVQDALLEDDSKVCELVASKRWCLEERARVIVDIEEVKL